MRMLFTELGTSAARPVADRARRRDRRCRASCARCSAPPPDGRGRTARDSTPISRERAEDALRVLEAVALRELALHRIVVHDDDARVARARPLELRPRALDLRRASVPDDRDVAQFQVSVCSMTPCDVLSPTNVAPATRSTGSRFGLMYARYFAIHLRRIAEAEWREPPGDVVIARHDDGAGSPVPPAG